MKAGIKDHRLPYTAEYLIGNLKCSETEAEDFLLAQSKFFAVTFKPLEFKNLGPYESVPFVVDSQTKRRTGGYGMVEKVFEGNDSFARKTIRDNYDTEKIMIELKILRLATETKNPHLLRLRCAYQQDNQMCLITHPWCEFNLRTFLDGTSEMEFWLKLQPKDKLILITEWMACLASGLSALHKKKIKHQDLKPENVLLCLLGDRMMPVIVISDYQKTLQMIPNLSRFRALVNTFLLNSSLAKSVERVMCSLLVSSLLSLDFFSLVKKV